MRQNFMRSWRKLLSSIILHITEEDTCTRDFDGNLVDYQVVGGIDACKAHLDESFALEE